MSTASLDPKPSIDIVDLQIGVRLLERRRSLNITQAELGERVGIARTRIGNFENGYQSISVSQLFLFAKALDTEITYFLEGIEGELPERLRELDKSTLRSSTALMENLIKINDQDLIDQLVGIVENVAELKSRK